MKYMQRPTGRTVAAGGLLALGLLASAAAGAVTVSGELTSSDPTFIRPGSVSPCGLSSTTAYYDVYTVTHTGGTLTIDMRGERSGSGTLEDPYLHLYSGSFDPANPCTNWVAGDDDSGQGLDSRLSRTLPAGTYVIVATSYDDYDDEGYGEGTYQLTYNSVAPAAVPTLGEWSLMALGLLLAGGAAGALRRRQA